MANILGTWRNGFALVMQMVIALMIICLTKEVLQLIMEHKKRKDIAEILHVSENTVKKHTSHIYIKLDVTCRKELFEKLKTEN